MSNGFVSNLIDSGYSSGTIGTTGPTSYTAISADIYLSGVQIGVYILDQSTPSINIPIPCSLTNLAYFRLTNNIDDGWIVYPGWAVQAFNLAGYTGLPTNIFLNNTSLPIFFSNSGWTLSTDVFITTNCTTSTQTSANTCTSVKIWFRGVEITISGLS